MAKKKASNGIFEHASKLRKAYPRKYSNWQDYVQWAKRERKGKTSKPATKRSVKPKKKRSVGTTYKPVKGIVHAKAVGSVAYHKSQARKQLEEQLAWLLLARDQEKKKRERLKLSKKVALKRQELQHLK